jgi:hypothetical protein
VTSQSSAQRVPLFRSHALLAIIAARLEISFRAQQEDGLRQATPTQAAHLVHRADSAPLGPATPALRVWLIVHHYSPHCGARA